MHTYLCAGILCTVAAFAANSPTYAASAVSEWLVSSLALKGGTLVVGAPWLNDVGPGRGRAFVFREEAGQWNLTSTIKASDGEGADQFGYDVATDGTTIVAGDPDHSLPGSPSSIRSAGTAYIYQQTSNGWTEIQKLVAPVASVDERFGHTVDISGNTAFIGSEKGVSVFENIGGVWNYQTKLLPSVPDGFSLNGDFGSGIELAGNVALIAAPSHDRGAINSGAVFAYERGANGWTSAGILAPSETVFRGSFGYSLDMSGDTAIIGRPGGGPSASGPPRGAAYIFEKVGNRWVQSVKLQASDSFLGDGFGESVAIAGDYAAVTGGDKSRVYLFSRTGGAWQEIGRLNGLADFPSALFGLSLEMDGTNLAIGARVDGGGGGWTGTAYVYRIPEPNSGVLAGGCVMMLAALGRRSSTRVGMRTLSWA